MQGQNNIKEREEQEITNTRNILRSTGYQSDLSRDKSLLNFAFTMFMGVLAAFNFIKTNTAAMLCSILSMLFCLISVFLSLNVLKNNKELSEAALSEQVEPKESFKTLLLKMNDRCAREAIWAYRFFWAAIICLVLCVVLYSGLTVTFVTH